MLKVFEYSGNDFKLDLSILQLIWFTVSMSLLIDWLDMVAMQGIKITAEKLELLMKRTIATRHCSVSLQIVILKTKHLVESNDGALLLELSSIINSGIKAICGFESITISQRMKLLRVLQGEIAGFAHWNCFEYFKDIIITYAQSIYQAESLDKLSNLCICFLQLLV